MRLLFDEQLSEELVKMLDDLFPDSLHIRLLGAGGAADPSVWQADLDLLSRTLRDPTARH